jgi:flagellar biosynthetic protein FlhB
MAGGGEKTEKATPKRRDEARAKGTVAKSADLNGALILAGGIFVLTLWGPHMFDQMERSMRGTLAMIATPNVVTGRGLGAIFSSSAKTVVMAVAPVAFACMVVGVVVNVMQVKWKPSTKTIKPDPKKLNPISGAKNLFGPNMLFETGKNVVKVSIVGAIVAYAVIPKLGELAGLVGLPPGDLMRQLVMNVLGIAKRAAVAYLMIGIVDYIYQRWRTEKGMKMDKNEVKEEQKSFAPPAEVRAAMKQRQREVARARMMSAVPEADVVVTNPTHYAVALKYDGDKAAPEVVAKGKDLIAAQIRKIAGENDVPVISDPPLARSLHASVEVGRQIPEELYAGVAQLLAFVYRVANRRAAA